MHSARLAAALAIGSLMLLAGCGQSQSDAAKKTAIAFAQDLLDGNGPAACAVLSPASRAANDAEFAVLYDSRYTQKTDNRTCTGYFDALATSTFSPGVVPQLSRRSHVSVRATRATVTFAGGYGFMFDGPNGNEVRLVKTSGSWRVQHGAPQSREANIRVADALPAAIASWNRAIQLGAVLPPPLSQLGSQQIWAYITPRTASVETPYSSETYLKQSNGSWSQWPTPNPPRPGTLDRKRVAGCEWHGYSSLRRVARRVSLGSLQHRAVRAANVPVPAKPDNDISGRRFRT